MWKCNRSYFRNWYQWCFLEYDMTLTKICPASLPIRRYTVLQWNQIGSNSRQEVTGCCRWADYQSFYFIHTEGKTCSTEPFRIDSVDQSRAVSIISRHNLQERQHWQDTSSKSPPSQYFGSSTRRVWGTAREVPGRNKALGSEPWWKT